MFLIKIITNNRNAFRYSRIVKLSNHTVFLISSLKGSSSCVSIWDLLIHLVSIDGLEEKKVS